MNKSIIPALQKTFGDRSISRLDKQAFEQEHGCELEKDWLEFDEKDNCYYLTPEILDYQKPSHEKYEALGLGELEERIVDVLEEGKNIKWGKLAIGMWLFFLFIVVYTIVETLFQINLGASGNKKTTAYGGFLFQSVVESYFARSL